MSHKSGIECALNDLLVHDALKHWHTSIVESGNDFDRMKSTLTAIMPQLMQQSDIETAALAAAKTKELKHNRRYKKLLRRCSQLNNALIKATTTKPADMAAVHPCACTTIQQDEHCPVGCPSLLCDVCDGKGVLPYIKLDGAELWEIIFGIATEAAHEITDEQYSKIADHINSVFIQPESAAIRALPAVPAQGARPLEEWHEDHGNVVWWAWDNDRKTWLGEPAYIGKPLDRDWPEYHTHWTPHPTFPAAPTPEAVK